MGDPIALLRRQRLGDLRWPGTLPTRRRAGPHDALRALVGAMLDSGGGRATYRRRQCRRAGQSRVPA